MFHRYLPKAYRAAPAFIIDSLGRRSRQIDIAIFDQLYSPLLFPHASGVHVPAESVYAVFEIKPTFSRQWVRDAADKAASVRDIHRTTRRPQPILAGLLAAESRARRWREWTGVGWSSLGSPQVSLEATCLANFSVLAEPPSAAPHVVRPLLRAQLSDGSWPSFIGDGEPSRTTALAICVLNSANDSSGARASPIMAFEDQGPRGGLVLAVEI